MSIPGVGFRFPLEPLLVELLGSDRLRSSILSFLFLSLDLDLDLDREVSWLSLEVLEVLECPLLLWNMEWLRRNSRFSFYIFLTFMITG